MTDARKLQLFEEILTWKPDEMVSLALPLLAQAIVTHAKGDVTMIHLNYIHVGMMLSESMVVLHKAQFEKPKVEAEAAKQVKELFEKMGIKLQ